MKRIISFIFGLSLLIGLLTGYLTSENKYYYIALDSPKSEVTYGHYQRYMKEATKDYNLGFKVEKIYNTQNAILFGLSALGGLTIIFSLINFSKKESNA
jgi:hypothetical protein